MQKELPCGFSVTVIIQNKLHILNQVNCTYLHTQRWEKTKKILIKQNIFVSLFPWFSTGRSSPSVQVLVCSIEKANLF